MEERLRLLAASHSFSNDGSCQDASPSLWSLVSLPHACRHSVSHLVPGGVVSAVSCMASFSHNSNTNSMGYMKPWLFSRVISAHRLCLSILMTFPLLQLLLRGRRVVQQGRAPSESTIASCHILSPHLGRFCGYFY